MVAKAREGFPWALQSHDNWQLDEGIQEQLTEESAFVLLKKLDR